MELKFLSILEKRSKVAFIHLLTDHILTNGTVSPITLLAIFF